ncbi:MAG: molecular chaperone DnaK [Elusimicrobia bacterium]|nr:molecular chaperone DnaK [Elusimicrobiota bacterium]
MSKIIGIDLGTSNTAAAVMEAGKPVIIPSAEGTTVGGKAFPSYVAFTKEGQLLVGEPARRQAVANTEGTVSAFKRKMGQDFHYNVHGKQYTPQQMSAYLLQKVKRDAEAFLGDKVEKAVITVPAYFNDNQRQATKDAGMIAGLEVVRIINEPTSACLAYGLDKKGKDEKIMVFDLGGGTLDVTIMDFGSGVFEVVSTSGDTQLGGTDMDNAIVEHIAGQFRKETGVDLTKDLQAMQRVREASEKAKIELSNLFETEINIPFVAHASDGSKHLAAKLTRSTLESLIDSIVKRCRTSIDQVLSDAKMKPADITRIILVGGPTRMPVVQKFVEDYVGRKVERGVDPMECVALGAAIQAAVLTGEVKDILLLDVTPLTLGIETLGQIFTPLIERNTTIPVKKSQTFSTAADNQTAVTVHVLQGERPMARDNVSLGRFDLVGIPPAPRGIPQIEVSFDIDANGIIHVMAKDLGTGKEQSIKVSAPNKLKKEEIDKFVKEAEKYAEEDKKRREVTEAKNELDTAIYATEKALKDYGDKISQDERLNVERELDAAKAVLKDEDAAKLKQAKDKLLTASHKLAEAIYKDAQKKGAGSQGQGAAGQGPGVGEEAPGSSGNGKEKSQDKDKVVDAEVVEEKDKGQ